MNDVRNWLESLGLSQYVDAFESSDVDLEVLPSLNEGDLEKLGVSLGHRKKMLKALAELRRGASDALASAGKASTAIQAPENSSPVVDATSTGERRQLTVMFCDLVGSTALSEKLDPEELRSLLHNYRTVCGEVIARYEGYVARYVGDGILTYFGWPKAHEEDAERALRAALEIVHTVKSASSTESLAVRIGIATGPVVVGEQAGVGEQSKLAIGATPNLAARLQGLASADQIVIASSTRRLVRNAFDLTDLGEHELKGISERVHAWRVIAIGAAASRFEAAAHGFVTPMVGREQELGLLLDRWQQAQQGEGQVVLLSGEPGIGKSRVMGTLRERLEAQGAQALRFQCSPYHINSAFYPSIDNFERVLKFGRDEAPESKLDKLEALMVKQLGRPLSDVRFIASLLSIPYEERYGALPMTPQKFKDETLRTLTEIVEAIARQQPAVMLFEDLHWADPTSLETLDLLIDRVRKIPLLILLTHRPEFQSRWSQHGHVTALNLSKLTRAQSGAIVDKLTQGKELPAGLLDQILTKTDGVPLYVEELTKSILESGELKDIGDRYDYVGTERSVTIPATLRDSLMARLDRFPPVKEIARIGATIGREFSYELVAAVAPHSKIEIESALNQLTESGLAFRRGNLPNATYIFKHALVRDAAYDSLLKTKRHELHAQIADTLEKRFSNIVVLEPETLAQHLASAGIHERAAPYWLRAGERALGTVALVEAVGHLVKALSAVNALPSSTERDRNELRIRLLLSTAYLSLLGWAAIEVAQTLGPARELAIRLNENDQLIPILYYIWFHHLMRCEYGKCRSIVGELDVLAQSPGDSSTSLIAGMTTALTFFFTGEIGQASQAADRVFKAYEPEGHRQLVHIYNHDPKCLTLVWAGYWLWAMGYPDKARQAAKEQLEMSRRLEHPFNLFVALSVGTVGLIVCGETSLARQWLAEAKTIAEEHAMKFMAEVIVPFWDGPALIVQGDHEEGYARLTVGSNGWRGTGPLHLIPFANIMRARALTALERFDEATDLLNETLQIIAETGHRSEEAEVYCAIGDLQRRRTHADTGAAEVSFKKGLEIARFQGAKGWELRAATGLASLWRSQGKRKEAHDLLAPVYNWFTEGFDTKDLIEAKALVEALA